MTVVYDQSAALNPGGSGTDDGNSDGNQNCRQIIPSSVLSAASGNQFQLRLRWGSAGGAETGTFTSMYFGKRSGTSGINFTGDQVQVLVGGSGVINALAGNTVTDTDVLTLGSSYDNTSDYLLSFHFQNTSAAHVSVATVTGFNFENAAGADESSATNPALTYGPNADVLVLLELITITQSSVAPPLMGQIWL